MDCQGNRVLLKLYREEEVRPLGLPGVQFLEGSKGKTEDLDAIDSHKSIL